MRETLLAEDSSAFGRLHNLNLKKPFLIFLKLLVVSVFSLWLSSAASFGVPRDHEVAINLNGCITHINHEDIPMMVVQQLHTGRMESSAMKA